ncbi:2Fe-2S iron-sulfur cluster-binding protein [Halalkalicoccus ordinarius]|uniref:2Fe-2S iron-sulfur cluster-binding protein n=1 Tax=Halalkalicoccus ordinarius TaxID=3116651 RepID=UPI00300F30D3
MVDVFAASIGAFLTLTVVVLHFARGTERSIPDDISEEVLERRAATVPETDFPEPMNRAIGGGGGAAAAVGAGGEGAEGELEEGGEEAAGPGDIPEDEIEYFEIEYAKEGETIEVANNETLLEAGEDEGWDLPYACRQGQCVSCGGQIADGPSEDFVEHDNQQMLDENELEDGYTLTCVAYPRGEFTLETNETP